MTAPDLSEEQRLYLEGLASGFAARRAKAPTAPAGPDAAMLAAQDKTVAAGGRLSAEEQAKRSRHPLDRWNELAGRAARGEFPKGIDVFLTKYHGLFYVAPAEDAFMCRLRIPAGLLTAPQLRGLADIAEHCGGGFADVTTRANLQIRRIPAARAIEALTAIHDLGLATRGSGADNIRNVTASPTAGIDPQELIDTRALAKAFHHHVLNNRDMYGLPRKFNVAFDGGGRVAALEDTNDIGFAAVEVPKGAAVEPGIYFRLELGGITGHGDFARPTGVLVTPDECIAVAQAVVEVFIGHANRSDRTKARLKYLLDEWGVERFLSEVEARLTFALRRAPIDCWKPRPSQDRSGHIGVHKQKQPGLFYVGVVLPVGRLTAAQMRGLADIAEQCASGTVRLTVWQNLLVSDIPQAALAEAQAKILALGLDWRANAIRAGLVACTGNAGCKFAASDTKGHAVALARHLEARLALDRPINIHLTGCHHSCAQHYIGDIGLLGTKIDIGEATVDGYRVFVGGGAGLDRRIAREIGPPIPFEDLALRLEHLLGAYFAFRATPEETFCDFAARHDTAALGRMLDRGSEALAA